MVVQHLMVEELFLEKIQRKLIDLSYASRYLAKNVVASKIAEKCLIQLAYAIGVSKPLSIYVDLFDNDEEKNKVQKLINENFDLTPRGIREMLGLNKPIYEKTAAYGHFGRDPELVGFFLGKD